MLARRAPCKRRSGIMRQTNTWREYRLSFVRVVLLLARGGGTMNAPWLAQPCWRWLGAVAALAVITVMLMNEQRGALFAQASIAQANGAIYYVAPNGNDSNPGSEAQPF